MSLYPLGPTPPTVWRVLVLTVHIQRSEQCGEILRQFCLQQKEERAGAGDPSGLHIIWNSEIRGESYSPVPCHSVRTQAGLNCLTFFATFFALFECFLAGSNQGDRTRAGRLLQPHAADRREQPETRHSLPLKEQKVPDTASLSSAGLGLCITMDTITLLLL